MRKTIIFSGLVAFVISLSTVGIWQLVNKPSQTVKIEHVSQSPSMGTMYTTDKDGNYVPLDFTDVAADVVNTVVHIRSSQTMERGNAYNQQIPDPFRDFFRDYFGDRGQNQPENEPYVRMGTGSGVIINDNGYIVTNNHVIKDADDIEVTLHDNRVYKATVVGTDPTTDLALIQIKEKGLPTIPMANSDNVRVGEWVLAVGNPFSLNSTVTAGIVSATGRNINILQEKFAVESFIQTDAAINPGNSGGALVNMQGALVGINTAIQSRTGTYNGYGFAVPANIVSKVVEDLLKFGTVQRGVLGVMIRSVDGNFAKERSLDINHGAYVDSLLENSAAGEAGIAKGDIIMTVDGKEIASSPQLQEAIARHRPGDKINVGVNRKGKMIDFDVVLNNPAGNKEIVNTEFKDLWNHLGINVSNIDDEISSRLNIKGGVVIKNIYAGKMRSETQMKEGFIVTHVDGKEVRNVEEFAKALKNKSGGVMLEGVYEELPGRYYYAFGMNS